jgi:hypothetical protein
MTDTSAGQDLSLRETLAAAYAEFEAIGQLARANEDKSPELFAAFMSAACAAADGRDAIATAPALAHGIPSPRRELPTGRAADPAEAADTIAAAALLLTTRLEGAARSVPASSPDHHSCLNAASDARHVHQLMAPADDCRLR